MVDAPHRTLSRAFMDAREKFHSARNPDTAKAYADAALATYGKEPATLTAVAGELEHAGFADEAKRVSP